VKHYVSEADKMLKLKKYEEHEAVKKEASKNAKLENFYLASNNKS
jgi:hypothetical protein